MEPIRVLLADDQQLFREGLANILNTQPDFEVVGEASDGLEVFAKARELGPDLILMDVRLRGCDGVEATERIKEILPEVTVVILTVRDESDRICEAIRCGAQGYLLKNIRSWDLVEMLRRAMRGEAAITPELGARLLEEYRQLSRQLEHNGSDGNVSLTPREQDVLALVAQDLTDQEIADELSISIHTVKTHMRNILTKLQLDRRHEAARHAMRLGLISPAYGSGLT
ncbi:MAG: response regulator [Anaerolineae bacterium]